MAAYTYPRRVTSTATTIAVQSSATALSTAAAALGSNAFSTFAGNDLTTTAAHPYSGRSCNVLEDGGVGVQQTLGWSGKGCYDPTSKKVLWMGNGASRNSVTTDYNYNTLPIYSETANSNAGAWSAVRQYLGDGTPRRSLVHTYDGNCIDVTGRRLFHKYGDYSDFIVYSIDAGTFSYLAGPPSQNASLWWHAAEVIPTIGTQGALWTVGVSSASGGLCVWQCLLSSGGWSILKSWSDLGSPATIGDPYYTAPVISYNSRAFSGAGGVMIGYGANVWTINCSTLDLATASAPPAGSISSNAPQSAFNSGFCRDPDPVGDGWLHFSQEMGYVYRYTGGAWTQRAAMPFGPGGAPHNFIVIPIDYTAGQYGVVWLIDYDLGPGGRLYKP